MYAISCGCVDGKWFTFIGAIASYCNLVTVEIFAREFMIMFGLCKAEQWTCVHFIVAHFYGTSTLFIYIGIGRERCTRRKIKTILCSVSATNESIVSSSKFHESRNVNCFIFYRNVRMQNNSLASLLPSSPISSSTPPSSSSATRNLHLS